MGIFCKRMEGSSLETLTAKVMERRKNYYRDDRGHRSTLEASERLRFCFWIGFKPGGELMIFSDGGVPL